LNALLKAAKARLPNHGPTDFNMLRPLLALLAVVVMLSACGGGGGEGRLSAADADPIRLRHLDAVNAVRAEAGLQPVALSAELNAAAETHARDMYVQQRAWHFGSDLTSPRERAFRAGYRGEVVGENLAEGQDSDLQILQSWMQFRDTRDVIMDPKARGLGLGWFQEPNSGKIWWVELLGE
jgi:uncharacterized protein YkwD